MLKIYGVYRSRASRNIWLANELGIPFKHVPVMQLYRLTPEVAKTTLHTRSQEFLKVNPNGHIPSIDDDGLVLHESLAINLYLAKKHGGSLAAANLAEDAAMTMWALWAAIGVEPHSIQVLYHRVGNKPEERDPKSRRLRSRLCAHRSRYWTSSWPPPASSSAGASRWRISIPPRSSVTPCRRRSCSRPRRA
jgi:glutathione S-transferase